MNEVTAYNNKSIRKKNKLQHMNRKELNTNLAVRIWVLGIDQILL